LSIFDFICIIITVVSKTLKLKTNTKEIDIEICDTFFKRFLGFMFQRKVITTGKYFPNCNSIHTFFMFQGIDLVFCDASGNIVKRYENFQKMKILLPVRGACCVYELPLNTVKDLKNETKLTFIKD